MSDTNLSERRRRRFESPVPGAASESEEVAPFALPPETSIWAPIDDAARTGRPVALRSAEGEIVEAVYRNTRVFNRSLLKWEGHAFWALRNGAGAPVPFEPVGYRVLE